MELEQANSKVAEEVKKVELEKIQADELAARISISMDG